MDYRIEQTKEQKFLARIITLSKESFTDKNNQEIQNYWKECFTQNLLNPIFQLRPKNIYGLCSPIVENKRTVEYGIGVLIDEAIDIPSDFQVWNVKAGTYAVFECMGEDGRCIKETFSKFYEEILPQMDYEVVSETNYEKYFGDERKDLYCELWIPIRKKENQ